MLDKFLILRQKREELTDEMSKPEISTNPKSMKKLGREFNRIDRLMKPLDEYEQVYNSLEEDKEILENEQDEELRQIASNEIEELSQREDSLRKKLISGLMPPDPNDGKNIIMEIRAGTGGDEAGLFAGDLFRMYQRLAEVKGWKIEIINENSTNLGGYKEIIFVVEGDDAYETLQYEGGVHRVQRVPKTETSGRIHTSAASVTVLPEAEEEDIEISDDDLRIDYYAASGHGGQHVNRTYSAVRIVHIPTGLISTCQDEKSQHKNRAKALRVLKSRLMQKQQEERDRELMSTRRNQIRSGDRSEKIRTYNFPQNRITDHRIGYTAYNLSDFLEGNIMELVEALKDADVQAFMDDLE